MASAARRAYLIATRSATWAEAVEEIIRLGLADCPADADALIYEGEEF